MPGHCPNCGCDGTPPLWDRLLRFLSGEIRRVDTPRTPAPGSFSFTFVRKADPMATNVVYRLTIAPVNDPANKGYELLHSVNGEQKPQVPATDGQEFTFPVNAMIACALIPVGVNGPDTSKSSEVATFVAKDDTATPPVELQRAPTPQFTFVRSE